MKSSTDCARTGFFRPALAAGLACVILTATTLAQAGKVTPPPLPPGSALVKVEPGMDKEERKREDRAHSGKNQGKRDYTKDDSEKGNGKGNDK